MSRSVQAANYRRDPVHISEVLAECFKETESPVILTAWADAQDQIPGQTALLFCDEVNSEFTSTARPGADWGTWEVPC